jgi:cytochrome P450
MSIHNVEIAFEPLIAPDRVFEVSREMRQSCPVAHAAADGGFWVISSYADVLGLLQSKSFEVGGVERAVRIPADPPDFRRPLMPPQDVNPPLHRQFRALLNPYLSPETLKRHEPGFRRIIQELIQAFHGEGRCDLAHQFAKVFPSLITFEELFGITDRREAERARGWLTRIVYEIFREDPKVLFGLQQEWNEWVVDLIARRRHEPRRDDIIDGLVFGTVEGRALRDDEILGAIQVLTLGGFMTTADATCNLAVALIERPDVQVRLRDEHQLIPSFIEEVLRMEPPVTTRARRCTEDSVVRDQVIPAGDRVMVNIVAANRDPAEFDRSDDLIIERERNRHLTFGAGIHRCIGSNMARIALRIVLEEMLSRMGDIRYADDELPTRQSSSGSSWRLVTSMPITFTPLAP